MMHYGVVRSFLAQSKNRANIIAAAAIGHAVKHSITCFQEFLTICYIGVSRTACESVKGCQFCSIKIHSPNGVGAEAVQFMVGILDKRALRVESMHNEIT